MGGLFDFKVTNNLNWSVGSSFGCGVCQKGCKAYMNSSIFIFLIIKMLHYSLKSTHVELLEIHKKSWTTSDFLVNKEKIIN